MKYILVWMFLSQVCSPKGTGYEAPLDGQIGFICTIFLVLDIVQVIKRS